MLTLEEIIQLILKQTDYDRKQIIERIEQKRNELGRDIVNDESAAMIVARELGIDLQQILPRPRMRIVDITENTRNVVLTARVVSVDKGRTFARSNGSEGKVASMIVADETGKIRVTLWDELASELEEDPPAIGSIVQIIGAYVKRGLRDNLELNIGKIGRLKVLDEAEIDFDIPVAVQEASKVSALQDGTQDVTLVFKVLRVLGASTFTRAREGTQGKVMSVIGGDETGSVRVVFWDQHADVMNDVREGEVIKITGTHVKMGRGGELEVHSRKSSTIERHLKIKIDAVMPSSIRPVAEPIGKKRIAELTADMRDVDVEGMVVKVEDVKTFEKSGTEGKRRSIVIGDELGSVVRVTFWNQDVERIAKIKVGDTIRILHAYAREGLGGGVELHIGQRTEVEINPSGLSFTDMDLEEIEITPTIRPVRIQIRDLKEDMIGKAVEFTGEVVAVSEISPIYLACSHKGCGKKVDETESEDQYTCPEHGIVKRPMARFLFKLTIDDQSETVRVTIFHDLAEKLLGMHASDAQKLLKKKENPLNRLEGQRLTIRGIVRKFRDNIEISAHDAFEPDTIEEIKRVAEEISNR